MVPAEAAVEKKPGLVGFQVLGATIMRSHPFHFTAFQI